MSTSDGLDDHFGLENIPFGIASASTNNLNIAAQVVTHISGNVIFLTVLAGAGHFKAIKYPLETIVNESTLNRFAALPRTGCTTRCGRHYKVY